jgi:hypothetical protein
MKTTDNALVLIPMYYQKTIVAKLAWLWSSSLVLGWFWLQHHNNNIIIVLWLYSRIEAKVDNEVLFLDGKSSPYIMRTGKWLVQFSFPTENLKYWQNIDWPDIINDELLRNECFTYLPNVLTSIRIPYVLFYSHPLVTYDWFILATSGEMKSCYDFLFNGPIRK